MEIFYRAFKQPNAVATITRLVANLGHRLMCAGYVTAILHQNIAWKGAVPGFINPSATYAWCAIRPIPVESFECQNLGVFYKVFLHWADAVSSAGICSVQMYG